MLQGRPHSSIHSLWKKTNLVISVSQLLSIRPLVALLQALLFLLLHRETVSAVSVYILCSQLLTVEKCLCFLGVRLILYSFPPIQYKLWIDIYWWKLGHGATRVASSLGMLNNNNKLIFSYTLCVVHKLGRPGYTALCLIVYTEYTALSVKYTASTQGSYTQH